MLPYQPHLKEFARALRRDMTETARLLWSRIRRKQIFALQFYRQKRIGPFIVDFHCPAAALVIEVDGGQHYEPIGLEQDRERDAALGRLGLRVLRFSNRDVLLDTEAVLDTIIATVRPL